MELRYNASNELKESIITFDIFSLEADVAKTIHLQILSS